MRLAWQIVKLTFLDFIEEMFLLFLFNVLWVLSAVLILPLPFATAGLAWAAAEIGEGKAINWRTFFQGGRRYWKPAYVWALVNLVVWLIISFNVNFYTQGNATWALLARSLIVSGTLIWALLQLYVFPLLIRQDEPSLKLAYRNALVLMARHPLVTLVVVLLGVALFALSLLLTLPLLALYFALIALLTNRAVAEILKAETTRGAKT
jgi:uncharacterized membrane protein YesL